MSAYDDYIGALIQQFWNYVEFQPGELAAHLESARRDAKRPPVFRKTEVFQNILLSPNVTPEIRLAVETTLPKNERHRYFGSMRSSQALAQSVFGNLIALGKVDALKGLQSDEDLPAFFDEIGDATLQLEYAVDHLGEPRSTSVDVWVEGSRRVAVECKLSEPDFGTCSRPRLKPRDANYGRDHCNGDYVRQRGRTSRCSLTAIGVRYWNYIPEILTWDSDTDMLPCPLRDTYQLIRNVLAACVTTESDIDMNNSHMLAIYDARNPAFQKGGKASRQWLAAKQGLRDQGHLRSCSWQRLLIHLSEDTDLRWLVDVLNEKYGFEHHSHVELSRDHFTR